MNEAQIFNTLLVVWFCVAVIVFLLLLFVNAPYGRHSRKGWGPKIGNRFGWVLMETPAVLGMMLLFAGGTRLASPTVWVFFLLWQFHYIYRAFIFPFLLSGKGSMPLAISLSGFAFNCSNAFFNGYWLFFLSPDYPAAWLTSPFFLIGTALFAAGFGIHFRSDQILRNMRGKEGSGYKIPQKGLFRWVSCPNYLGEMLQWGGWTIATWSLPGLAFFVWTTANLLPRALSNHRWYKQNFPEYSPKRKALIPFLL